MATIANNNRINNTIETKGSMIDGIAADMLKPRAGNDDSSNDMLRDNQWRKQSFITTTERWVDTAFLTKVNLDDVDVVNRSFTTAAFKYTDSSLGGNICINPPPQFTRYADIRHKGWNDNSTDVTLQYTKGNLGQGRYYSEAIDDNNQVIHMRFGVPQYNSLTQFFTGFYNSSASAMARTGRVDDSFITKFLNVVKDVITVAILPLAIVPMGIMMLGTALRFFMNWPASKFYYLKPAMPLYWKAVSEMVNQIGVNKGVISYMNSGIDQEISQTHKFDSAEKSVFSDIFPGMTSNGLIDVYSIANRAKRLEMSHRELMQKQYDSYNPDNTGERNNEANSWYGKVKRISQEGGIAPKGQRESFTLETFLNKWIKSPLGNGGTQGSTQLPLEKDMRTGKDLSKLSPIEQEKINSEGNGYPHKETPPGFMEFMLAQAAEGSEWASFRVDYTGSVSESFSNSTGESTLAQKLNSTSSDARNLRVNFADGNVDSAGIISTILEGTSKVIQSAADVMQVGGMAAFAGNSFVDIPAHWESASASLPKTSYTLTLISPYGNAISHMLSIYVPLAMLLAGALPLSTGKQSYTSPFLCELYDQGRSIIRLGVIDSLSIQRGSANLGFNNEGQPMSIDVTFSIKDLSSIVAMPISQGFSLLRPMENMFDTENTYSDYLLALSSLSLRDCTQRWPVLKNQIARKVASFDQFFSASHLGAATANLPGVNQLGMFFKGAMLK